MSIPTDGVCPVCNGDIEDDDDTRSPDLTETEYHPECWEEAVRNTGQSFHPDHPRITTCSNCKSSFDYPPRLHMGVSYCMDCAPDGATLPDWVR